MAADKNPSLRTYRSHIERRPNLQVRKGHKPLLCVWNLYLTTLNEWVQSKAKVEEFLLLSFYNLPQTVRWRRKIKSEGVSLLLKRVSLCLSVTESVREKEIERGPTWKVSVDLRKRKNRAEADIVQNDQKWSSQKSSLGLQLWRRSSCHYATTELQTSH